jgi:hypothetical protein
MPVPYSSVSNHIRRIAPRSRDVNVTGRLEVSLEGSKIGAGHVNDKVLIKIENPTEYLICDLSPAEAMILAEQIRVSAGLAERHVKEMKNFQV